MERKTGILLTWRYSGKRVGIIEIHPQGILIYRVIAKELFQSALEPVEKYIRIYCIKTPLIKKYTKLLDQRGELPHELLQQEALIITTSINEGFINVGGHSIEARMVDYEDKK